MTSSNKKAIPSDIEQAARRSNADLRRAALKYATQEVSVDAYRAYRQQVLARFAGDEPEEDDQTVMQYRAYTPKKNTEALSKSKKRSLGGIFDFSDLMNRK